MNNDTFMKKQIQEMMKEFEVIDNINTYAYMQAAVTTVCIVNHIKKWIKLFGERDISERIIEFKKSDEGVIPVKPVVVLLNPDWLKY